MNLEELRAANAAEEAARAAQPEPEIEQPEAEEIEEEESEGEEQTVDVEDEQEDSGDGKGETEDWMRGDDQASQEADLKFGDSDIAKVRRKYKGKLKEEQDENARLKAELEELKKGRVNVPAQQGVPARPKRDDFMDRDDPDEAFTEALAEWKWEVKQAEQRAKSATETQQQKRQEFQRKVSQEVDQHYERAVKLAEKSGISPEMYQSADLRVRQAIDSVFTGAGDDIADALIAQLGEGSEKVMYNLGVNQSRLKELKDRLQDDPSGVKAAIYLGQLNAELKAPLKRKTNAPKPPPEVNGDAKASTSVRNLQKRYSEAQRTGNVQAAYNIKKEARRAGADTSNW